MGLVQLIGVVGGANAPPRVLVQTPTTLAPTHAVAERPLPPITGRSATRRLCIDIRQALADISRSRYVVIATEPVHRLQIRPIVAQLGVIPYHSPKLRPGPCSTVGVMRGTDRHIDKQTSVTNIYHALSTTHAKCNKLMSLKLRRNYEDTTWVNGRSAP